MSPRFSLSLLLGLFLLPAASQAQTVIISQYIETDAGLTPKGIEVWNPSATPLNFATTPLTVFQGTNGQTPVVVTAATVNTGTLAPGAVLVIGTADIGTYLTGAGLGAVRFVESAFVFNGDDALQLRLSGTVTDVFGTPGTDPGTEWVGNGVSTLNQNIQLRSGITTPNTAGFTDPSIRYETVSTTPSTLPAGLTGFGVAPAAASTSVTVSQSAGDGAGYRLLGAPVQGVTVGTLAGINLVQSVVGQYPDFPQDNLFLNYTGSGATAGYVAATDIANDVTPGRGFFWYLFDQNIDPDDAAFGGGTSQSYVVPERMLTATGTALTGTVQVPFTTVRNDGFYMIANPFAVEASTADVSLTAGGGTLADAVQVYNPTLGFQPVSRASAAALATWQGFFAEVQGGTTAPTFTFIRGAVGQPPAAPAGLAMRLDGTTADGTAIHDEAAIVRIADEASAGWDAGDASKLVPPTAVYALVAPVGTLDGAARRQAVLSLPATTDVTLAFTATAAGTYTLTAETTGLAPGATVRDLTDGRFATLAEGLTFTADATDWTERFVVSFARTTGTEQAATGFALGALYPNPAVGRAALELRVDAAQTVRATVVDALGRTVATLFEGALSAGQSQTLAVETAGLAPGVYVVRVQGATFTESRRLVVAR